MVSEFSTIFSRGTSITLSLHGTHNVSVDWDDSNTETYTSSGDKDNTYTLDTIYIVSISGTVEYIVISDYKNPYNNANKVFRIISFGDFDMSGLFYAS